MNKTVIKAEVVADSINQQGDRLTSLRITFPRIILAEVNTHRMLSKNTSSSRAIPFKKMVETVQNDPFIPIAWQKNHSGMQGNEYLSKFDKYNLVDFITTMTSTLHAMIEGTEEHDKLAKELDEKIEIIETSLMYYTTMTRTLDEWWLLARDKAVEAASIMYVFGITKQLANRLLEPFMWTTMLITGSKEGWSNFFNLRCPSYRPVWNVTETFKSKKDAIKRFPSIKNDTTDLMWLQFNKGQAEIHMMALAEAIYDEYQNSVPLQLKAGEWHIPYYSTMEIPALQDVFADANPSINIEMPIEKYIEQIEILAVKVSTAMAARESYTVIGNEKDVDYQKQIELHDRLIEQDPPHCFTEGTEILTNDGWKFFEDLDTTELVASINIDTGEFNGFEKPISYIEDDYHGKVYTYKDDNIDISVTPNHKLLGLSVSKSFDRQRDYDTLEIIEPGKYISDTKTLGEREMIMFSAPKPTIFTNSIEYNKGRLLGFFLGDGSTKYTPSIHFRLKKQRKVDYLMEIVIELQLPYSSYIDPNKVHNIEVIQPNYNIYYDEDRNKRIPEYVLKEIIHNIDFVKGLFDGLKNSDGSVKRKTWVYDTFSTPLRDNILFLCPLVGLTGVENPSYEHHRISFMTNNRILINDSRRRQSKVKIEEYEGKIYCVEIPSKGIIVRKNGKVLITHNSSPLEHCARAMTLYEYETFIKGVGDAYEGEEGVVFEDPSAHGWCNNIKGFIPYRYMIDNNLKM